MNSENLCKSALEYALAEPENNQANLTGNNMIEYIADEIEVSRTNIITIERTDHDDAYALTPNCLYGCVLSQGN